jgi:hypothetical protein
MLKTSVGEAQGLVDYQGAEGAGFSQAERDPDLGWGVKEKDSLEDSSPGN